MTGSALENYNFQKIVAVVGVSLMLIKFFAYFLTSSVAILTDALESIVNVIAAFIGLFALYLSAQPPDRSHPFGHGKIETISASVEGTLITVAGALIIAESVYDLIYHPNMISDLDIGLLLIIFAAAVNYIIRHHPPSGRQRRIILPRFRQAEDSARYILSIRYHPRMTVVFRRNEARIRRLGWILCALCSEHSSYNRCPL